MKLSQIGLVFWICTVSYISTNCYSQSLGYGYPFFNQYPYQQLLQPSGFNKYGQQGVSPSVGVVGVRQPNGNQNYVPLNLNNNYFGNNNVPFFYGFGGYPNPNYGSYFQPSSYQSQYSPYGSYSHPNEQPAYVDPYLGPHYSNNYNNNRFLSPTATPASYSEPSKMQVEKEQKLPDQNIPLNGELREGTGMGKNSQIMASPSAEVLSSDNVPKNESSSFVSTLRSTAPNFRTNQEKKTSPENILESLDVRSNLIAKN